MLFRYGSKLIKEVIVVFMNCHPIITFSRKFCLLQSGHDYGVVCEYVQVFCECTTQSFPPQNFHGIIIWYFPFGSNACE